jgi:hypothetical protein
MVAVAVKVALIQMAAMEFLAEALAAVVTHRGLLAAMAAQVSLVAMADTVRVEVQQQELDNNLAAVAAHQNLQTQAQVVTVLFG